MEKVAKSSTRKDRNGGNKPQLRKGSSFSSWPTRESPALVPMELRGPFVPWKRWEGTGAISFLKFHNSSRLKAQKATFLIELRNTTLLTKEWMSFRDHWVPSQSYCQLGSAAPRQTQPRQVTGQRAGSKKETHALVLALTLETKKPRKFLV